MRNRDMIRTAITSLLVLFGVFAASAPAAAQAADVVHYYHTDAVGSVRLITDESQQTVSRHDYFPFGQEVPQTPTPPPETRRFAGKERDTESSLDYFGGRYYQGSTGRFTTVDPVLDVNAALQDPQRWNRYAYVRNGPMRFVDPDGRAIETAWDVISLGLSLRAVRQDPTR
jgi:RHS repeat-associated protein